MTAPTVASLCNALGSHLTPADGFTATQRTISAVHISELLDPTAYLTGGELLLTTGLSLPRSKIACQKYVRRLADADLSALAIGLGPVHVTPPAPLVEACHEQALPLLVVPEATPFLTVTRAYWTAVSRSTEQEFRDALAIQKALVDAAVGADPEAGILRTLARSLPGWAARLSATGDVEGVFPPSMTVAAEEARDEIRRLDMAGVHSAASLSAGDTSVVVFPLDVGDRIAGYLAAGTQYRVDAHQRRMVLTACALLSIDASRRRSAETARDATWRCVALLVEGGHVDAARSLAAEVGAPPPGTHARVLVLRSEHADDALALVRTWCDRALAVPAGRSSAWALVPVDHPAVTRLDRAFATSAPGAVVLASDPVRLDEVGQVRALLTSTAASVAAGTRRLVGRPFGPYDDPDVTERLDTLCTPGHRPLLQSLAEYLRHHGQWESAALAVGVHRNTLRQRIQRCRDRLELDLDDPDVRAQLWLAIRRRGLA